MGSDRILGRSSLACESSQRGDFGGGSVVRFCGFVFSFVGEKELEIP